jgi:hypothetical protein
MSLGVPYYVHAEDFFNIHVPENLLQPTSDLWDHDDTDALVLFRNSNMESSRHGEVQILAVGPDHTYTSVAELEGKPLGDVPSRHAWAEVYCLKPNIGYMGRKFNDYQRQLWKKIIAAHFDLRYNLNTLEGELGEDLGSECVDFIEDYCVGIASVNEVNTPKQLDEALTKLLEEHGSGDC